MNTNDNSTGINDSARTAVVNVSVINDLLDTANYIDESEIITQAIGFFDNPNDHVTGDELVRAAARIYADVHYLKSEMNKLLSPFVGI